MIVLAYILSGLSLLMSVLLLIHPKSPIGWIMLAPKLVASALAPAWVLGGVVGAVIGWAYQGIWAVLMGVIGAGMMTWYIWRCTREHNGFDKAFGTGWSDQIPHDGAWQMVRKRWSFFLKMNAPSDSSFERDIPFWTIPGTDRELLCDIWWPGNGNASGLVFIYFHGGGWWFMDKDFLTRPFFNHLVAQGHTVMDVSYRLCPEVDIYGMIADIKRAIAWMKTNASQFGVDPEKIVLGGGSACGHLALLAAYAPHHPDMTPEDVENIDLSVSGVISYYGPTDMLATYHYTNSDNFADRIPVPIGPDTPKVRSDYGRIDTLLGGHPEEVPEMYDLASPVSHVHPACPPTLLIQGNQDLVVPINSVNRLYSRLVETGVPAINLVFPWTAHGFDLLLPQVNPASQSTLYDVDRFLAIMLN